MIYWDTLGYRHWLCCNPVTDMCILAKNGLAAWCRDYVDNSQ